MTARTDPQDYRSAPPADSRVVDNVMAEAAAAVIGQLAARFTAWRRELGFDEARDDR